MAKGALRPAQHRISHPLLVCFYLIRIADQIDAEFGQDRATAEVAETEDEAG